MREADIRSQLNIASASERERGMLVELRAGLWSPGRQNHAKLSALKDDLRARFDALDIEARRELIRALLDITVLPLGPGQSGAKRWRITHKVVESLNDEQAA